MRRILVFNEEKSEAYQSLILQVSAIEDVSVVEVKATADLEVYFNSHPIRILILMVNRGLSQVLLKTVLNLRNMTAFRDVYCVSIHKQYHDSGLQEALMAGAKSIYLEPIHQSKIAYAIRAVLNGNSSSMPVAPGFYRIEAVPCQVEVFGRIGKIFLDTLGNLHVEVDAKLKEDQPITIRSLIGKEEGFSNLNYVVSLVNTEDNFYQYKNNFYLSWQGSLEMKKSLTQWIHSNQNKFSLPKTKVLWISSSPIGEMEKAFDKSLFSLHVNTPGRVTSSYLRKLNPKIVIVGRLPDISMRSIQSWADEQKEVIMISTEQTRYFGWYSLPISDVRKFAVDFKKLIKPYLSEQLSKSIHHVKYLDRKSKCSRFTLLLDARITSIENLHLTLELETEIEQNTIFKMSCASAPNRVRLGLYLKVLKVDPLPKGSGFQLICEVIPITDQPELHFKAWWNWVQKNSRSRESQHKK